MMLQRAVEAHTRGDVDTAAQLYVELERRYSPHWHARMMGALLHYQRTSDPTHALEILPAVILAKPSWPDPRYNLGVVLEGLGRFEEAARRFEETVALDENHSQAWTNLGNARLALGDVQGSLAAFQQALDIAPADPLGLYNMSHVYGLLGEWSETWRLFEYRWLAPGHLKDHGLPKLIPAWDGTPTGHLIALGEQGAGDTIQYARFIPRLKRLCQRLTVIIRHRALVPLLAHSFPGVDVLWADGNLPLSEQHDAIPDADAHVPLMSIVARLGLKEHHVQVGPYLAAPTVPRLSDRRTIGLCWAGSPTHKRDATRSIPFEAFEPLLSIPDVQWVNLTLNEPGDVGDARLLEIRDRAQDYLASASIVQTLDLVVTIDSSPLHLAGALGVPTLALIGASPDFRWSLERVETSWYKSVHLLRQPIAGDWGSVIARAGQMVRDCIFPLPALSGGRA